MVYLGKKVVAIIPALDEEQSIGRVVSAIDRNIVDRVIVVDNGSVDDTKRRAMEAGAEVLREARRGYGSACLRGILAAKDSDIFVFLDGDGSDDPAQINTMLDFMEGRGAELVIGSRVLGSCEPGALTPIQRFGNSLTCNLVRLFWGVHFTDLGPFRAVQRQALERMDMKDPDFGWTIEMQVKAARMGLRVEEMPVTYHNRYAGKSKVSGTLLGSYRAGKTILGYVFRAKIEDLLKR